MSETKTTRIVLAPFDTIFGRICLERGWATREEIIACLKTRPATASSQAQAPFLASLLVERGVISTDQEESLRKDVSRIAEIGTYEVARQDASLGKILVEMKAATPEQIAEALQLQKTRSTKGGTGTRLGEALLELGIVSFGTIKEALRRQEAMTRLKCPSCDSRYAVTDPQRGRTYLCRKCTAPLSADSGILRTVEAEPEEVSRSATNPKNVVGKYVVVKELGRGGSGAVYKAWDRELRRWVALKILMGSQELNDLIRFRREAETAAGLQHPSIVPIYDIAHADDKHFIAMKYIDGNTLYKQQLEIPHACRVMAQVARAIDHAHQKDIVHRDLKPANIMLDGAGNPYVMDFGLAKDLFGSFQITAPGTVMGTPNYMPPEQAEGNINRIDARSDTYSLGAILYELLTGQPPFEGETVFMIIRNVLEKPVTPPTSFRPEIPSDLEHIVLTALAKKKKERYQSARELAEDLESHLAGKPARARPSASQKKPVPPARGRKWPVWVVAVALIGVLLVLLWILGGK